MEFVRSSRRIHTPQPRTRFTVGRVINAHNTELLYTTALTTLTVSCLIILCLTVHASTCCESKAQKRDGIADHVKNAALMSTLSITLLLYNVQVRVCFYVWYYMSVWQTFKSNDSFQLLDAYKQFQFDPDGFAKPVNMQSSTWVFYTSGCLYHWDCNLSDSVQMVWFHYCVTYARNWIVCRYSNQREFWFWYPISIPL